MRLLPIVVLAGALAGCAQTYQPVIDTKGVDPISYQADLADCRQFAGQVDPAGQAMTGALAGGLLGAALGAATGAAFGDAGTGAAFGAAVGGGGGGAQGLAGGVGGQVQIIRNCMAGRGYRVLL